MMMETTARKKTTTAAKVRKRTSVSKDRTPNSQKKPGNKYVEAALKHQGSFIVYDPNFML